SKHSFCPSHIILYSIPIIFILAYLSKKHFSTTPNLNSLLAGFLGAGISEIVLSYFCYDYSLQHITLWHFLPWIIPVSVSWFLRDKFNNL
ncbi:MAG: DUF1109 family protein, partial [Leptospiraceae bacterium]|nr:DUF1109 family protein [Leptospiraceae bacterium]